MSNEELRDVVPDPEVAEEFEAAEKLGEAGREQILERIEEHNATSPELAAGDIDAAWDEEAVGEELPGGGNPTPDQDIVEKIGEALGNTYEDNEPLKTGEKIEGRDDDRWEMDPASAKGDPASAKG